MAQTLTPEVLWAQRASSSDPTKNIVFLTLNVSDVAPQDLKLDITPTKLTFTGTPVNKKTTYHVELEFYAEIDPDHTKINHTNREIQLVLQKKDAKDEFWPRLLKEKAKLHFLKTDFDKWVDEDEQDEAGEEDLMGGMNPFAGAGGGAGQGFEGIDFSKLGSGPGGEAGPAGEDDDDDMPELEEVDEKLAEAKKSSGIEEVE
ncbi:HSP20-like chaperone [Trichodelitschia bisporula]|uniref:HSP20-like chaperone n=1 Tax=Trichodelitschia bisporula TaxID=703511 RepID=A0A6G1HZH7_9PEZI|nr:HSP20-like chaperone [Trichodelitschia bisporula]